MKQNKPSEQLLQEMYQPAELHPDLQEYFLVQNGIPMIKHPLVYSIFHFDIQNYIINQQYEWKKKSLKEAVKKKNWGSYIFLHERPYRFEAFVSIAPQLEREPKLYWELLGSIWVDSENIWQNQDRWKFLIETGPKKNREYFMSEEDRETFKNLPETLTVYRGYTPRKNKAGFSYTLSKDKAIWFANRFGKNGKVIERTVNKKDIFAYKNDRSEQEIIILD
jgi:hypothetical protein